MSLHAAPTLTLCEKSTACNCNTASTCVYFSRHVQWLRLTTVWNWQQNAAQEMDPRNFGSFTFSPLVTAFPAPVRLVPVSNSRRVASRSSPIVSVCCSSTPILVESLVSRGISRCFSSTVTKLFGSVQFVNFSSNSSQLNHLTMASLVSSWPVHIANAELFCPGPYSCRFSVLFAVPKSVATRVRPSIVLLTQVTTKQWQQLLTLI